MRQLRSLCQRYSHSRLERESLGKQNSKTLIDLPVHTDIFVYAEISNTLNDPNTSRHQENGPVENDCSPCSNGVWVRYRS
eukprot:scaffold320168_cov55-Attheya_sp.AAC.3